MLLPQATGISFCRGEIDDSIDGKVVFNFSPLIGTQDGVNTLFQVPSMRVVVGSNLFFYKNGKQLGTPVDYSILVPKTGSLQFVVAPLITDQLSTTFPYTWMDDIEIDHHMQRGANELGYTTYYTGPPTIPGTEAPVDDSNNPIILTDFPSGLISALVRLGAAGAASALSSRFAQKYDISAGDKHYSPSEMAKAYETLGTRLRKEGLTARDDFYKGQGRQYRPSIAQQGYVLPNWTPPR